MPPKPHLSIPTTAALPHSRRLPPTAPDVTRILTRLTRASLIDVAIQWLDDANLPFCAPFLDGDVEPDNTDLDSAAFAAAVGIEEIVEVYEDFKERKGGRTEVFDRIVEGDWRHGISLHQLAIAETRVLLDRPTSLRWNAFRLAKVDGTPDGEEMGKGNIPRVNPSSFMMSLQQEVAAVARAHYYMTRLKSMPITLLRVYIHDSPYNTHKSLKDTASSKIQSEGANTLWIAFPDGSPFVYVSLMANMGLKIGVDVRSLKQVVVDAIPKALSRPHCRYVLQGTALHTRSLDLLLSLRGPGRSNNASGGWSIFAKAPLETGALHAALPVHTKRKMSEDGSDDKENDPARIDARHSGRSPSAAAVKKRRVMVASGRFGASGVAEDKEGLERLDIRFDEPFPNAPASADMGVSLATVASHAGGKTLSKSQKRKADSSRGADDPQDVGNGVQDELEVWRPEVRISWQGAHVFAGIRRLVEAGVVDGERMPGWMTGEAGVSVGVVRAGKILSKRNSAG